MKLLHLNVESFRYIDALMPYLARENPDICSFVEASDGDYLQSGESHTHLVELAKQGGYEYRFFPTTHRDGARGKVGWGSAVLSRFPIIETELIHLGPTERATCYDDVYPLFTLTEKYERYPYVAHMSYPLSSVMIASPEGTIRVISTHLHVTEECQENDSMIGEARQILDLVRKNQEIPTIVAGDFNIRKNSETIRTLETMMTLQAGDFSNTLCPTIHPIFRKHPEHLGLAIDHIFTRNVSVNSCDVHDVAVSDHLPIVIDFVIQGKYL